MSPLEFPGLSEGEGAQEERLQLASEKTGPDLQPQAAELPHNQEGPQVRSQWPTQDSGPVRAPEPRDSGPREPGGNTRALHCSLCVACYGAAENEPSWGPHWGPGSFPLTCRGSWDRLQPGRQEMPNSSGGSHLPPTRRTAGQCRGSQGHLRPGGRRCSDSTQESCVQTSLLTWGQEMRTGRRPCHERSNGV